MSDQWGEYERMLDHDTQEPYEEPREWWEVPMTFLIVFLVIVIIIMVALA